MHNHNTNICAFDSYTYYQKTLRLCVWRAKVNIFFHLLYLLRIRLQKKPKKSGIFMSIFLKKKQTILQPIYYSCNERKLGQISCWFFPTPRSHQWMSALAKAKLHNLYNFLSSWQPFPLCTFFMGHTKPCRMAASCQKSLRINFDEISCHFDPVWVKSKVLRVK